MMVVTGFVDGQAFSLAPKIWLEGDHIAKWLMFAKTMLIFILGLLTYIAYTYFMHKVGISNSLIIVLIWFVVTIISVALISGSFFTLSLTDKLISISAIILIGLLYYRGIAE